MRRFLLPLIGAALGLMVILPVAAQSGPGPSPSVMVATDPKLGKILVDGKGMTLYLYSRDTKGTSNCYDACEQRWPILRPPADGKPTGSADIGGPLGTIARKDGTMQVTYNDIPLYYYTPDQAVGDTKGQASGGVSWILAPGLKEITPAVAQPSPSPAAAAPAAAAAASPAAVAQAPSSLPRAGSTPLNFMLLVGGFGAAGVSALAVGARLLRRGARRPE
jgi:predicted lipoprotein with Yx(FWY)xxD motif